MEQNDSQNVTKGPPCKKFRSVLSPLALDSASRVRTPTKSPFLTPKASSYFHVNDVLDQNDEGLQPPKLSPNFYGFTITPKSSAAQIDSPLKRKLEGHGIQCWQQNPIKLGKGNFGTVVLGFWEGKNVAIKIIGRTGGHHQAMKKIRNSFSAELNAKKLDHQNIVKIFSTFEDDCQSMIVMEYVGQHSLQNVIEDHSKILPFDFNQNALIQISKALAHCHERCIIHLDIKPANILVSSKGVCKLIDFGCSMHLSSPNCYKLKSRTGLVGTPGYMAPELLLNKSPTSKCDVYSFGITMWQLLAQATMPFPGIHMHTIMFKVVSENLRPDDQNLDQIPMGFRDLYSTCWSQNPESRPSMSSVVTTLNSLKRQDSCLKPVIKSSQRERKRSSEILLR